MRKQFAKAAKPGVGRDGRPYGALGPRRQRAIRSPRDRSARRAQGTQTWPPNPGSGAAAATLGDTAAAGCVSRAHVLGPPPCHGSGLRLGHVGAVASASANGRQPHRVQSAEPGRGGHIKGARGGGARPRETNCRCETWLGGCDAACPAPRSAAEPTAQQTWRSSPSPSRCW